MKYIKMKHLLVAAALLCTATMQADVKLPKIFSDGMVMQQQTKANLWGTATAGKNVVVTTGWNKKKYTVKADADGKWSLAIETSEAGGPYTITLSDGKTTTIDNVLIGELWLCSGQSNMEMPMKGFKGQPVENANTDALQSTNPNLRLFTVKRNSSFTPKDDVEGSWEQAEAKSVREFSATAYYFGRMLQRQLNVPVGLVVAAWGGSACEAWMQADWLRAFPDAKIPQSPEEITSKNRTPTVLYNGMLHPLVGMTIKGVIWYQGEDNYNRASTYSDMFTALVNGWRAEWKQGNFPFYYCQIAPWDYAALAEAGQKPINSAFLREQQSIAEKKIENTGMVVLMDVGSEKCIHPTKKIVGGERLARLALVKSYGLEGVTAESPRYKGIEIKNDTVVVSFERAQMWLNAKDKYASQLFKVAGEDHVFHPAKAWIERSKVYVKSDSVAAPVAVRYAFENYVVGDLYCEDLPVPSFRSDDWEE
jgi:sialate O-acetylesterase